MSKCSDFGTKRTILSVQSFVLIFTLPLSSTFIVISPFSSVRYIFVFKFCSLFITPAFAVNYGDELKNSPNHTYTVRFSDVDSNYWAYSYIMEMVNRGVLNGYPNGKFYPDKYITRAELAKILTIASGLSITDAKDAGFSDVGDNDWFKPYVNAAANYLNGYNVFGSLMYIPQRDAIREDLAVALVKLKGYDIYGRDESILSTMFTDADSISGDAKAYIATALEKGLISGYEDDTFRGQNSITRAEASALLWRAYQYGNGNKNFEFCARLVETLA